MFTNIPFMIITVYIIILFAIGFYAKSKSTGDADSYIRASKQLTAPLVFVSMVGLVIGGASTIGISESAFKIGLSAGWYNVGWGVGGALGGFLASINYHLLFWVDGFTNITAAFLLLWLVPKVSLAQQQNLSKSKPAPVKAKAAHGVGLSDR